MRRKTGIILAWDKSTCTQADNDLIDSIVPYIDMVKVGLEAMSAKDHDHYDSVAESVRGWMSDQHGTPVMWDAKLHDIGNTVERTIRNIVCSCDNIRFITVHAAMSDGALSRANAACAQANVTALAVTLLTDIDERQCLARFGTTPSQAVLNLATIAYRQGIKGFVCSAREVFVLRNEFGNDVTLVVPGVRPTWAAARDQTRVATPREAANDGADYIVVGRPILEPPEGITPIKAIELIRTELDGTLAPPANVTDKRA